MHPALTVKMRCGCEFHENGALIQTCAGHRDAIIKRPHGAQRWQRAKRQTETPTYAPPIIREDAQVVEPVKRTNPLSWGVLIALGVIVLLGIVWKVVGW